MSSDILEIKGRYIAYLYDHMTGRLTRIVRSSNLITRAGTNLVGRMLLDIPTYDIGITYQAIGNGATSPTVADVALESELVRRAVTTRSDTTNNKAAFFTFFPSQEVPDTIAEVGIFGHQATEVSGSGILFSRSLLSILGAAQEDLVLSYVLTIG